jgi:hypothetical protein
VEGASWEQGGNRLFFSSCACAVLDTISVSPVGMRRAHHVLDKLMTSSQQTNAVVCGWQLF